MAGSLMDRIRVRMEQLQVELQPEPGFDRSAYGYEDDAAEDASFEDVDRADESPWRRPGGESAPAPAERYRAAESPGAVPRVAGSMRPPAPRRPTREASSAVPPLPAAGGRVASPGLERTGPRRADRLQRLRRRIRNPDSLRELFLLREVIDRPIALRRPRPRR